MNLQLLFECFAGFVLIVAVAAGSKGKLLPTFCITALAIVVCLRRIVYQYLGIFSSLPARPVARRVLSTIGFLLNPLSYVELFVRGVARVLSKVLSASQKLSLQHWAVGPSVARDVELRYVQVVDPNFPVQLEFTRKKSWFGGRKNVSGGASSGAAPTAIDGAEINAGGVGRQKTSSSGSGAETEIVPGSSPSTEEQTVGSRPVPLFVSETDESSSTPPSTLLQRRYGKKLFQKTILLYQETTPRFVGTQAGINSLYVLSSAVRGSSLWDLVCDILQKTCVAPAKFHVPSTHLLQKIYDKYRSMAPPTDYLFDASGMLYGRAWCDAEAAKTDEERAASKKKRELKKRRTEKRERREAREARREANGGENDSENESSDGEESGESEGSGSESEEKEEIKLKKLDTPLDFYEMLQPRWRAMLTLSDIQLLFRICRWHAVDITVGAGRRGQMVGLFDAMAYIPHVNHEPTCFWSVHGDGLKV